jgi:hypothetical protein
MLGRTLLAGLIFASLLAGCGSDENRAARDGGSGSNGAGGSAGSSGGSSGSTGSGGSNGSDGSGGSGGSTGGSSGTGGGGDGSTGAAGSGGAVGADDAGTTDSGTDAAPAVDCLASPQVFPTFDRVCWDDFWCAVLLHQTDCCGNQRALGMLHPEFERLTPSEQVCKSQYPACDCAGGNITTDTGQTATVASQIKVQCRANVCTSYVP